MFDVVVRRMLSLGLPLVLLGGCTEVVQTDGGGGGAGSGGAPAGGAPSTGGNSNGGAPSVGGAPEGGAEPVAGGGGVMGPGGGMNEGGGMMGPHPCENQDDCEGNCPPESEGCSCENTPMGMFCVPTCETPEDCPPGPMGTELTCNPNGICVPEMPNP